MAIAKTQDMTDHAIDCKRTSVCCATLKPVLRVNALEPEDPVEVLPSGVLERVFEHLDLLQEDQVFVIGRHLCSRWSANATPEYTWAHELIPAT